MPYILYRIPDESPELEYDSISSFRLPGKEAEFSRGDYETGEAGDYVGSAEKDIVKFSSVFQDFADLMMKYILGIPLEEAETYEYELGSEAEHAIEEDADRLKSDTRSLKYAVFKLPIGVSELHEMANTKSKEKNLIQVIEETYLYDNDGNYISRQSKEEVLNRSKPSTVSREAKTVQLQDATVSDLNFLESDDLRDKRIAWDKWPNDQVIDYEDDDFSSILGPIPSKTPCVFLEVANRDRPGTTVHVYTEATFEKWLKDLREDGGAGPLLDPDTMDPVLSIGRGPVDLVIASGISPINTKIDSPEPARAGASAVSVPQGLKLHDVIVANFSPVEPSELKGQQVAGNAWPKDQVLDDDGLFDLDAPPMPSGTPAVFLEVAVKDEKGNQTGTAIHVYNRKAFEEWLRDEKKFGEKGEVLRDPDTNQVVLSMRKGPVDLVRMCGVNPPPGIAPEAKADSWAVSIYPEDVSINTITSFTPDDLKGKQIVGNEWPKDKIINLDEDIPLETPCVFVEVALKDKNGNQKGTVIHVYTEEAFAGWLKDQQDIGRSVLLDPNTNAPAIKIGRGPVDLVMACGVNPPPVAAVPEAPMPAISVANSSSSLFRAPANPVPANPNRAASAPVLAPAAAPAPQGGTINLQTLNLANLPRLKENDFNPNEISIAGNGWPKHVIGDDPDEEVDAETECLFLDTVQKRADGTSKIFRHVFPIDDIGPWIVGCKEKGETTLRVPTTNEEGIVRVSQGSVDLLRGGFGYKPAAENNALVP